MKNLSIIVSAIFVAFVMTIFAAPAMAQLDFDDILRRPQPQGQAEQQKPTKQPTRNPQSGNRETVSKELEARLELLEAMMAKIEETERPKNVNSDNMVEYMIPYCIGVLILAFILAFILRRMEHKQQEMEKKIVALVKKTIRA